MTILGVLLTSFFANNVALTGYGLKTSKELGSFKGKHSWILFCLYFIEALVLGGVALLLRGKTGVIKYLAILIFVLIMAVCTGLFYLLNEKCFKEDVRAEMKDNFYLVAINSSLLAIATSLFTFSSEVSNTVAICSLFFLPIGYLLSSYVFSALYDRVNTPDAPKGFRGMPLLLLCVAGLCLGITMLSF
jgi:Na+-translocating ferredoxin:NAD+ oxidoreductase RnfA subunit